MKHYFCYCMTDKYDSRSKEEKWPTSDIEKLISIFLNQRDYVILDVVEFDENNSIVAKLTWFHNKPGYAVFNSCESILLYRINKISKEFCNNDINIDNVVDNGKRYPYLLKCSKDNKLIDINKRGMIEYRPKQLYTLEMYRNGFTDSKTTVSNIFNTQTVMSMNVSTVENGVIATLYQLNNGSKKFTINSFGFKYWDNIWIDWYKKYCRRN